MPTNPRPMRLVEGGDSLPSQQFVSLKIPQAILGFIGIGAHFGWAGTPIFPGSVWADAPTREACGDPHPPLKPLPEGEGEKTADAENCQTHVDIVLGLQGLSEQGSQTHGGTQQLETRGRIATLEVGRPDIPIGRIYPFA